MVSHEIDNDLNWERHGFQGATAATGADDRWIGLDHRWDLAGRLIQTSATDSRILGALPAAGANGAANGLNQVSQVAGRAAGLTWSDAGNMATDGRGWTFTHNGLNQLTRAVHGGSGVTMAYAYDTGGLRIESIRNPTGTTPEGTPSGGTRTRYLLSGAEAAWRAATGSRRARQADIEGGPGSGMVVKRRFVPGAAIDERLAEIDATTGAGLVTDGQNSVLAVLDAQGNPVVRRGYGAYGGLAYTPDDPAQMTGAGGAGHPFGYTGRRWDPDLQLYYYRARWYDPQLGTFLQTDPIGAKDYINLYSYVGLSPGNATDPTGKWMCTPGTSSQECDRIGQRIQGIARARDQYPRNSREYRKLNRAYRVYGEKGERNGVWVGLEDLNDGRGGYASAARSDQMDFIGYGAQFLGAQQWVVIMDRTAFDSPWQAAGYPTVSAEIGGIAALAHEGYHIWQFASGTMPNLPRIERERQAYRVQTDVYRARWGSHPAPWSTVSADQIAAFIDNRAQASASHSR